MKHRNLEIDSLRGLACILLVSYHVVGNSPNSGLRIEAGLYRDVNDLLSYLRMPLFSFISGVVYAYRPYSHGFVVFMRKKARRLLLPLIFVGTGFAILQYFTPNTNSNFTDWATIHIYPVAHYWFLEAIFIIFILVVFCEMLNLFRSEKTFALVFIVSCVLNVMPFYITIFAIDGVFYLLLYFLVGMAFQRYDYNKYLSPYLFALLAPILISILALIQMGVLPHYSFKSIGELVIGMLSCITVLSSGIKTKFLSRLGLYSYSIYLFHVFFVAASRIVLLKVGLSNLHLLFAIGLALGIVCPIATEHLLKGTNATRVALLGKSPIHVSALWLTKRLKLPLRAGS